MEVPTRQRLCKVAITDRFEHRTTTTDAPLLDRMTTFRRCLKPGVRLMINRFPIRTRIGWVGLSVSHRCRHAPTRLCM